MNKVNNSKFVCDFYRGLEIPDRYKIIKPSYDRIYFNEPKTVKDKNKYARKRIKRIRTVREFDCLPCFTPALQGKVIVSNRIY